MPRPTLQNIRGLPDFMTVYDWTVEVTKPPVGVAVPPNFNFQAQTSTIPTASNTPIEIDIRGHKIRQQGLQQYDGTLDLQLVETIGTPLMNFIRGWREAQWATDTGVQQAREAAKANLQLQLLNRQNGLEKTFDIIGGILTNYTLGELSGDGSEVLRPTLTITYDYFKDA